VGVDNDPVEEGGEAFQSGRKLPLGLSKKDTLKGKKKVCRIRKVIKKTITQKNVGGRTLKKTSGRRWGESAKGEFESPEKIGHAKRGKDGTTFLIQGDRYLNKKERNCLLGPQ